MKRKSILIISVCICLCALTAFGTLAYFKYTSSVENKFMVAGYDPESGEDVDPDDLFSVRVYETDAAGSKDYDGLNYGSIAPADTISKDPTVQNTGSYSQWIRVSVTLTNGAAWVAACDKFDLGDPIGICDIDTDKWTFDGVVTDGDNRVYTYYLNTSLEPDETAVLFTNVKIPFDFDVDEMVSLSHFDIIVKADAIQTANTGSSAKYAFENFFESDSND